MPQFVTAVVSAFFIPVTVSATYAAAAAVVAAAWNAAVVDVRVDRARTALRGRT